MYEYRLLHVVFTCFADDLKQRIQLPSPLECILLTLLLKSLTTSTLVQCRIIFEYEIVELDVQSSLSL